MVFMILCGVLSIAAQERGGQRGAQPGAAAPAAAQRGDRGDRGDRGGRGGGGNRGGIQLMTLSSPAWQSGGMIPVKYTEAGDRVSPPLTWTGAPEGTASFVLIMRDISAPTGDGLATDVLHWMLWNIPATTTSLPEGIGQGFQLP